MTDPVNDDETLAAEQAMRLLSPQDEAAARARMSADPAFARAVEAWDERMGGLYDEVTAVAPSPGVWPRVQGRIEPANDNRLVFWRRWAVGSTGLLAAACAGLVLLLVRDDAPVSAPAPAPTSVTRVAMLQVDGGVPVLSLAYDGATGNLMLSPTGRMPASPMVPHLWLVMPDGKVQLVGAITAENASRHNLGSMMDMAGHAQAVAISMEQPGHTPAGDKPDGPVVASGELQPL